MQVWLYGEDYEQDIRPLIKSFLPYESVIYSHEDMPEVSAKEDFLRCFDVPCEEKDKLICLLDKQDFEVKLCYNNKEYLSGSIKVCGDTRRDYRNPLHRALYELLSAATGKTLPWGTLTGIRPTKQMLDRLEEGIGQEEIEQFFRTEYKCSEECIELGMKVATNEHRILSSVPEKETYSIYIGIPFCPSTCLYCSFTSYSAITYKDMMEPYLEALFKEIDYAKNLLPNKKPLSIYIGGGTPTTLGADMLGRLIRKVKSSFPMDQVVEFCVEAGRPDSITLEKLQVLKAEGVTRISINPQSMNDKTLETIGRRHSVADIYRAYELARQAGFDNINTDIIVGLTGENIDDVKETLRQIEILNPENLTVHTLAVKRAARLNQEMDRYSDMMATDVTAMMELCKEYAFSHGYEPYYLYRQKNMADNLENIGFSKPGLECIYNILIMEERHTILALGAGGSSKIVFKEGGRLERVENVKSVRDYIMRTDEMIERKSGFFAEFGDQLL